MTACGRLYAYGITPKSGRTTPSKSAERAAAAAQLDFGLFRDLKRIIDLDSKVSNGAFQLAMP